MSYQTHNKYKKEKKGKNLNNYQFIYYLLKYHKVLRICNYLYLIKINYKNVIYLLLNNYREYFINKYKE
jgi:hypothetical protein